MRLKDCTTKLDGYLCTVGRVPLYCWTSITVLLDGITVLLDGTTLLLDKYHCTAGYHSSIGRYHCIIGQIPPYAWTGITGLLDRYHWTVVMLAHLLGNRNGYT